MKANFMYFVTYFMYNTWKTNILSSTIQNVRLKFIASPFRFIHLTYVPISSKKANANNQVSIHAHQVVYKGGERPVPVLARRVSGEEWRRCHQGQISIDSDKLKNTRNPSSQFQTVTWSGSNICRQGAIFLRENLNITLIAQHVKIKLCVVYDIVLVFKSIFD